MSDAVIGTLSWIAAAGGGALVEAAVSDGWAMVRGRVAAILGRGDADREALQARLLEPTREALIAAEDFRRAEIAEREQHRLRDLLMQAMVADQALVEPLHALFEELSTTGRGDGVQVATASGHARQAVVFSGKQVNNFGDRGDA